jgi:hypothetical protein
MGLQLRCCRKTRNASPDYKTAARAHGFPRDFKWTKKKSVNVKLIGNSWPRLTAKAVCRVQLEKLLHGTTILSPSEQVWRESYESTSIEKRIPITLIF